MEPDPSWRRRKGEARDEYHERLLRMLEALLFITKEGRYRYAFRKAAGSLDMFSAVYREGITDEEFVIALGTFLEDRGVYVMVDQKLFCHADAEKILGRDLPYCYGRGPLAAWVFVADATDEQIYGMRAHLSYWSGGATNRVVLFEELAEGEWFSWQDIAFVLNDEGAMSW